MPILIPSGGDKTVQIRTLQAGAIAAAKVSG
jgi:hypothetical protein